MLTGGDWDWVLANTGSNKRRSNNRTVCLRTDICLSLYEQVTASAAMLAKPEPALTANCQLPIAVFYPMPWGTGCRAHCRSHAGTVMRSASMAGLRAQHTTRVPKGRLM